MVLKPANLLKVSKVTGMAGIILRNSSAGVGTNSPQGCKVDIYFVGGGEDTSGSAMSPRYVHFKVRHSIVKYGSESNS